jgi:2-oxo-4-hydroxy-4-carboxy--5-ureidoimidazoline (OHCU) decarboxylase
MISAAGKTTHEILAALRNRLQNDPAAELRVAAQEQRTITQLRLRRLCE